MYCGYELKTGSAGGWTGAWETAATEISGKGLEAPGRSTAMRGVDSVCSQLERPVSLEKGGICNKNYTTHCTGTGTAEGSWRGLGATGESKPGRNKT